MKVCNAEHLPIKAVIYVYYMYIYIKKYIYLYVFKNIFLPKLFAAFANLKSHLSNIFLVKTFFFVLKHMYVHIPYGTCDSASIV